MSQSQAPQRLSCFCIDMGTTNCRAWVAVEGEIRAQVSAAFGVRDVAKGLPVSTLREKLVALIVEAASLAKELGVDLIPQVAAGAGMITSAQGLLEISHLPAPASQVNLASRIRCIDLERSPAPKLFLIPGVKTLPLNDSVENVLTTDVMRGEECMCVGLLSLGLIEAGDRVLNLGSHWKWIGTDAASRIAWSSTAMTGELIHATQSQTLLASSLPQEKPDALDPEWLARGAASMRTLGLSRALFGVRLLDQAGKGTPLQRLAFLYGAFLEADIMALSATLDANAGKVAIVGAAALASAWKQRLAELGVNALVVSEPDRDRAFVRGVSEILTLSQLAEH